MSNAMREERTYDLIVLGGGPAGYLAAERAGAQGKSVLLVEEEQLGGVCLNWGCVPTKSLLHSAKLYSAAKSGAPFGVAADEVRFDLTAAMKWKEEVVVTLRSTVERLMKRHRVTVVQGRGSLRDSRTVHVGGSLYRGRNLLIATGSEPAELPVPIEDGAPVVESRELLDMAELPERPIIVGGGVIGMEFASFFHMLGLPVTVVEMMPEIVPNLDADIGSQLRRSLSGVDFHLASRVEAVTGKGIRLTGEKGEREIGGDAILVSVGRRPRTRDIGLAEANIDHDRSGVRVDERMQTSVPGVFAAGDVTGRSLLAHSAYRMAEVAVNTICGRPDRMRYGAVPWVLYSHPEAAGVGLSERAAGEQNVPVTTAKLPLKANGRFLAENGKAPGFCKVLADPATERLLGVQMLGEGCSELIFGAAAMIEAELRIRDIKEIIFPHPTVSEAVRDAMWGLKAQQPSGGDKNA